MMKKHLKLQIKILNESKAPGVRAYRSQIDKIEYPKRIQKAILNQENLTLIENGVHSLLIDNDQVIGVKLLENEELFLKKVVLTTGTYIVHLKNKETTLHIQKLVK